jgi:hypothetical protein
LAANLRKLLITNMSGIFFSFKARIYDFRLVVEIVYRNRQN